MPQTKTITIYTIDELKELSPKAYEKAYDWWREGLDYRWWDFVYEGFHRICDILGITVKDIQFSGFWSQGDGARFTGSYKYVPGAVKAIKEYAPQDETLHRIARDLQLAQRYAFYRLVVNIDPGPYGGNYVHEKTVVFSGVGHYYSYSLTDNEQKALDGVEEALTDLMRWLYRNLEKEYECLSSYEQFEESCEANGYLFDEHGDIQI